MAVIRLRFLFLLSLGAMLLAEAGAATLRQPGFPTRRYFLVIPPHQIIDTSVKLPPPPEPSLGTGAQGEMKLPANLEIEKLPAAKSEPPPAMEESAEKRKLKAERQRLNHNALLWQLERAKAGSATAMRSIGMRYLTGDGLEKNEAKAREWLKKGADGGDSAAIKELARMDAKKESEKNEP